MKILSKGKKNPEKPWIGLKVKCDDCECRFQLEASDKVKTTSDQRGGDFYIVKCPGCKNKVYTQVD